VIMHIHGGITMQPLCTIHVHLQKIKK
jgi:hypothetical protein